ncbi:hypothetical protein L198_07917 [Cryptococcus wingfieldii CBS 7118]|uniref:U3 small nucleolar RNA-associated protein 4 n=1 Tax=Cryptococcus wingfieldii CBS 7118 TaxID=1295528 RepID=A0A1E3HS64_9TREE|nr:hypothetical protein L198_07917 [Cryptococcus wingfieldii CBS 7118]ODN79167.1 hypothetical protein L198_07917 [Cryptococcus wingfieldii CBS 7118]
MATVPLHRIRFYDHSPSPIAALAFPPRPLPPPANPASLPAHPQPHEQFGALVLARENGEVEIWEYVRDEERSMSSNWVLQKTLPPTLTHPTISQIALVLRSPSSFESKPYSVPQIPDLRLFTAGSDSSDLVERCLDSGRVLQTHQIPQAPLWSLAVAPTQDLLVMATTSPNLHFLSIPPASMLDPSPALAPPPSHLLRSDALPSRTRTVSIAFAPPALVRVGREQDDEWEWRNTGLVTGNSDSSWRRWEIPPPNDGSRIGPSRVLLKGRAKATIVWNVGVLPDNSVVTTDSLGSITFWDPITLAQKQTFRAHKADIMALTIGPRGESIFTSGPDQRICQFVLSAEGQWVMVAGKRVHAHDVKALAVFPAYLPIANHHPLAPQAVNPGYAPVLVSGGLDMTPTFTSAASPSSPSPSGTPLRSALSKPKPTSGKQAVTFEESFPRRMGYLSGGPLGGYVALSKGARLVVGRRERSVGIWRVQEDESGWEKVLEMELRLRTHLISSAISEDGKWLAVSDLYETKLFFLASTSAGTLKPQRISTFLPTLSSSPLLTHLAIPSKGCGASSLLFTPDSQRFILGLQSSGQVLVLELPQADGDDAGVKGKGKEVGVVKCFERKERVVDGRVIKGREEVNGAVNGHVDGDVSMNGDDEKEEEEEEEEEEVVGKKKQKEELQAWVSSLAASADGQWLGVADLKGRISLYATLPTLPFPPTSLSFPPSTPLLAILTPTNNISFYHLEHRRLLPPSPELEKFLGAFESLHTPAHGIIWTSATSPEGKEGKAVKAIAWGTDYLATIKLDVESLVRRRRVEGSPAVSTTTTVAGSVGAGVGKASRKKRAREARQAREHLSSLTPTPLGSVPSTPVSVSEEMKHQHLGGEGREDYYNIVTDRFRSILGVGWLGEEGEVGVVERPWGDFVGDLPGVFWSAGYGRS